VVAIINGILYFVVSCLIFVFFCLSRAPSKVGNVPQEPPPSEAVPNAVGSAPGGQEAAAQPNSTATPLDPPPAPAPQVSTGEVSSVPT
jgi:hypothetical protein